MTLGEKEGSAHTFITPIIAHRIETLINYSTPPSLRIATIHHA